MCTHNIHPNRLFYFSIKDLGAKGFWNMEGFVLISGGKGDLGGAQVEFPGGLDQHQKQIGKTALGTKWTESSSCSINIYGFLDL